MLLKEKIPFNTDNFVFVVLYIIIYKTHKHKMQRY
jgi:hypothetical protein